MDDVARDDGAGLIAERIYAAHVGEPALTDIVYQIVANLVVVGHGIGISPNPADRNGGVIAVMYLIM